MKYSLRSLMPKRRWFQLSLKTLFLVTTLLAVGLGIVAAYVYKAERQQRGAEMVARLGGHISYSSERVWDNWVTDRLRQLLSQDYFDAVDSGTLRDMKVTDADLAALEGCSQLKHLFLEGTDMTDSKMAHLRGLKKLYQLRLCGCRIGNDGLSHLENCSDLAFLALNETAVTDEGMVHLQGLKDMEELRLDDTEISDKGLANFKEMSKLRKLVLSGTNVTENGIAELEAVLPDCTIYP